MAHVTTGFSNSLEAETGVYGGFPNENEGNVPDAATVDLELVQTQQNGDGNYVRPIADPAPPEK